MFTYSPDTWFYDDKPLPAFCRAKRNLFYETREAGSPNSVYVITENEITCQTHASVLSCSVIVIWLLLCVGLGQGIRGRK